MADTPETCAWTPPDTDASDEWETGCENLHLFFTGGPVENEHRFCPYCGGKLVVGVRDE